MQYNSCIAIPLQNEQTSHDHLLVVVGDDALPLFVLYDSKLIQVSQLVTIITS